MINQIFNLGVWARTNTVVWKYASHQLSRATVRRIDSLVLEWTRNAALARPAVPPCKNALLSERFPTSSSCLCWLQQPVPLLLSPQVMFSLLIVYCSKEFLALPNPGLPQSPGDVYFWWYIWGRGSGVVVLTCLSRLLVACGGLWSCGAEGSREICLLGGSSSIPDDCQLASCLSRLALGNFERNILLLRSKMSS